jgi:hypothetical protein
LFIPFFLDWTNNTYSQKLKLSNRRYKKISELTVSPNRKSCMLIKGTITGNLKYRMYCNSDLDLECLPKVCVKELGPRLELLRDSRDFYKVYLSRRSTGHWVLGLKGILCPRSLFFIPLCSKLWDGCLCSFLYSVMMCCLNTGLKATGVIDHGVETPKLWARIKLFLL